MRKYTLFVIAASIILLTVAGLSACGEAVPSPQTSQEVSPAPVTSTPTPTPPETATATPTAPAPTPSGGQVVLAEMFTGDW
jgi:cell division septation protein DedD